MARSLDYLRDQADLIEQLTHEAAAAQALADEANSRLDEATSKLDAAKSRLLKDAIKEYEKGTTPKVIHEMTGILRQKLHYTMNQAQNRKGR